MPSLGSGLAEASGQSSQTTLVTRILYRGERSSMTPEIVFDQGFLPKGTHDDALLHTQSNATAGNFVSSTSERSIAHQFAGKNGYVYEIESSSYVDIRSFYGNSAPFPEQAEYAIRGAVLPAHVKGAWVIQKGVMTGEFIPNPGFGK